MTATEIVNRLGNCVWGSINGHGRGDGYDVEVYPLGGRYLVRVLHISSKRYSWFVSPTLEGAKAVGQAGYTPGSAPGRYTRVLQPARLSELREDES